LLDVFTSGAKGLAPASGGGTTNFLRADGTWAAPGGGGGGAASYPKFVSDSGRYKRLVNEAGTTLTTRQGTANRIELVPYVPLVTEELDRFAVNVTTLIAASEVKIVVYASNADGWPDALLFESAALSSATTGAKTATTTLTLTAGVQYWVGMWHSSNATLSHAQNYTAPNLDYSAVTANTSTLIRRESVTFSGSAPNPWVFTDTEIPNGSTTTVTPPCVWGRFA
jgi:hypothetical protein